MEKPKQLPSPQPATLNKARALFNPRGLNNPRAFTLIEVMVAVSILGIAFLSVIQLISLGLKVVQSNEQTTKDIFLAQELMEEVIAKPFNEIVTSGSVVVTSLAPDLKEVEVMSLLKTTIVDN